jgi:hypothetical protein
VEVEEPALLVVEQEVLAVEELVEEVITMVAIIPLVLVVQQTLAQVVEAVEAVVQIMVMVVQV